GTDGLSADRPRHWRERAGVQAMYETSNAALGEPTTGTALAAAPAPSTMPGAGADEVTRVPAAPAPGGGPAPAGAPPRVVQQANREQAALYAAYMPFVEGGGLLVPTTRTVSLGDELYLILSLMDEPNKLPVTGKVIWITPAGTPGRQQGLGVQFSKDDAGAQARNRIETLLGGALKANRPTHTI